MKSDYFDLSNGRNFKIGHCREISRNHCFSRNASYFISNKGDTFLSRFIVFNTRLRDLLL